MNDDGFAVRQRFDDFENFLSRNRDRARLLDLRLEMRFQPDFQVRPRQLDVRSRRLDQDVGQDRHGVSFFDNSLEKLEFFQNVLFHD